MSTFTRFIVLKRADGGDFNSVNPFEVHKHVNKDVGNVQENVYLIIDVYYCKMAFLRPI